MSRALSYRPEIDGLRGIAVISVVLYHFEKILLSTSFFSGGFVGVDIFFVISGYLISYLIFSELKTKNSFSFKKFYIRRIKRILPVLIFVILFFSAFFYIILIPEKLSFYLKSAISSLFFISNIFFWKTSTVYDAEETTNISLLHTWSLSIEEQFYLIFPICVFLIHKFYRKKLILIIYLIIILSFLISNICSLYFPTLNFYSLPTRVWEILFGTVIAYNEVFKNFSFEPKKNLKIFSSFIFLFIVIFLIFGNDNFYHPSIITLVPVIFSVYVICFCRSKNSFLNKLLTNKALVFLGLISYSLYLWHYPIFVITNNLNISEESTSYIKYLIFFFSFLVSILSFYFIEKPFRDKSFKNNYTILISFIFSLIVCLSMYKSLQNPWFFKNINEQIVKQIFITNESPECLENFGNTKFCSYNKNGKNKIDVILLGDSVLATLINNLNHVLDNKKFRLISLSKGGSFYTPNGKFINPKNGFARNDDNQNKIRTEFLQNKSEKIIIIGYRYFEHFKDNYIYLNNKEKDINPIDLLFNKKRIFEKGKDQIKKDFEKNLNEILKNHKVILIYPFPEYKDDVFQALYIKNILKKKLNIDNDKIEISLEKYLFQNQEIINFLNTLESKNLFKIYPHKIFCKIEQKKCFFQKNKIPLYSDKMHLSHAGSELINLEIIKILNNLKF